MQLGFIIGSTSTDYIQLPVEPQKDLYFTARAVNTL